MDLIILMVVGLLIGIHYTPLSLVLTFVTIPLLSFALTSLGLTIGSFIESLDGFQLIISFVVIPLYFLSGALFPLTNLQTWLSILTTSDPATYVVDALRNIMLGITEKNLLIRDIMILLSSVLIMGTLGMRSFKRVKAV